MRTRRPKGFVSGFVSILGRPNAGKSTLLNALLESKLAIVSSKPQTTRTTIQGVLTLEKAQVIFTDTPGLHEAPSALNRRMMESIGEALNGKDLLLYMADGTKPFGPADEKAFSIVNRTSTPVILVINKLDAVADKSALLPLIEAYRQHRELSEVIPISARTGEGLDTLREAILRLLPKGPAYYPADYLTDQPERFMAAEVVREKILQITRQEVPHSVAVVVDSWKDDGKMLRISANIFVERPGQKAIVVGSGGSVLKRVGTEARHELEAFLGRRMHLGLFVKVQPNWRDNEAFLKELDWRSVVGSETPVPEETPQTAKPKVVSETKRKEKA